MSDRIALHRHAVAIVTRRARAAGFAVDRVGGHHAHDLLIEDQRIAVRAARIGSRRHRVTVRGKPYTYAYPDLQWTLHAHGTSVRAHVDTVVFVWRDRGRWRCYVVPVTVTHGVTLALHPRRLDPTDRNPHWLSHYEEKWATLAMWPLVSLAERVA
jgi:hypothetical protein